MSQELKAAKALLKRNKELGFPIRKTTINGVSIEIYNNSGATAETVRRVLKREIDHNFNGETSAFIEFYASNKIKVTTYPTKKGYRFSTF